MDQSTKADAAERTQRGIYNKAWEAWALQNPATAAVSGVKGAFTTGFQTGLLAAELTAAPQGA
jgi:hypothetical protein